MYHIKSHALHFYRFYMSSFRNFRPPAVPEIMLLLWVVLSGVGDRFVVLYLGEVNVKNCKLYGYIGVMMALGGGYLVLC